jgi:hypothetical protein
VGTAIGYLSTEQFCLAENGTLCADDQQFLAISETYALDALKSDGILGLSTEMDMVEGVPGTTSLVTNL